MRIEFGGYTYELKDQLTGRDFLELRRSSLREGKLDMETYAHQNLLRRLVSWDRPEDLNEENILNLPMSTYQVLYHTALKLDSKEAQEANDFLFRSLDASSRQELQSILDSLRENRPPGSEQPSQ